MQKQFEFRPFDRVTVNLHEENLRAVLSDGCGKLLSGAYADSYGLNNFFCDVERIKPGHYDADGNWLPQPVPHYFGERQPKKYGCCFGGGAIRRRDW